jgi:hypothetical protein
MGGKLKCSKADSFAMPVVSWLDGLTKMTMGSRAYDAGGTFVGRYNRFSNQTYDNSGRVFTLSGDALTALIFGKKRNR